MSARFTKILGVNAAIAVKYPHACQNLRQATSVARMDKGVVGMERRG